MSTRQSSTLAKGLALLQAIVADGGRSTLTEVAKRLAIPLATAHRLALTLEAEGYIERRERGHFLAGARVTGLQASLPGPGQRLAARLRRSIRRLALKYGVLVHFGVLEDGMVTYLVKENGGGQDLFTAEDMQLEAYCSGVGKVLLAALPEEELDAYLAAGPFVALTPRTLTSPDEIRKELAAVRHDGVAFDRYEVREDLFCVAVPVSDRSGRVVGGLSGSFLGQFPEPARLNALRRSLASLAADVARAQGDLA